MIVLSNIFVLNIAKNISMEITFRDSVKIAWDSTFVDALGPRDAIEINHKSNTENEPQDFKIPSIPGLRFILSAKWWWVIINQNA